jgi:hypothetical protein
MKDMLRYPAKTFFRDEHIAIIQPADEDSYVKWTPVINVSGYSMRRGDFKNLFIVRANNKEYFEVRKSASNTKGGGFEFGPAAFLDSFVGKGEFDTIKTYKRSTEEYLKKYPSLYDAFEEMAIKMAYLPMIRVQTDKLIWEAMEADKSNIRHIKNLTHKRKMQILKRWPSTIESMEQTQELCDFVVKQDGANISYISEHYRNQKLCERAVGDYASALQYVPNQTEKICLIAIKRDPMSLKYVKKPTMKMYVAAVNRSPNAWNLIKKEKLRKEVKKAKKQKKYQT